MFGTCWVCVCVRACELMCTISRLSETLKIPDNFFYDLETQFYQHDPQEVVPTINDDSEMRMLAKITAIQSSCLS